MSVATDPRGQTLHDFAIGMAIFLLVLGYVFAFIPGLFQPFVPETDSTAIRVDRTADFLTRDLLINGETAGLLNVTCTRYFFNGSQPTGCDRLTDQVTQEYVRDLAALPARTTVNVTMVRNGTVATYPGSDDRLAFGPPVEDVGGRVIRGTRIVLLDGRDYTFIVRAW